MTTNRNPAPRIYYVPKVRPKGDQYWPILDATADDQLIARLRTRKEAVEIVQRMNEAQPLTERELRKEALEAEGKPDARTAHKNCEHPTTKLARAICRRARARTLAEAPS